jgi:U3 small nucleolar RNA-associated protein 25
MQSFAKDAGPQAKRRRLNDSDKSERTSIREEPDDGPDDDEGLDVVEEPEEGPDDEVLVEVEDDDDDENPDSSDPFETHFANSNQSDVAERLEAIKANAYSSNQSELNGLRLFRSTPGKDLTKAPATISGPLELKLKQRLSESAAKHPTFDKLEQVLYPLTFAYNDLLYCGRTTINAENLRYMACLHAVNHVFKTRDRVLKNNYKLAKEGEDTEFEPRDQGFTRPKVLIILPTRQSAVKVVDTICAICEPDQQENRKRFDESYIDNETKFSSDRPEDFRELFEGNDDDMFRLGVKFTRKTIKYFAQFYNSDILIGSPLGLRMAIGSDEDKKKSLEHDFLSSIETVIVDQADALLMQNWEHVEFIFEHLNLQPREAHGCDFSRVREWYLEKQAQNYRQTIIFSAFNTPELTELHRHCQSWAGSVRVQPQYRGKIQELGVKAKQTFSRFDCASIAAEPDARFEYFKSAIVSGLVKSAKDMNGTLIFVPSYLDFVRVRNYFATSPAVSNVTFGAISEYTDVREASRARSHFLNGRLKVLLYTERAHHFRRYVLSGVRRVIMYNLPDNPLFYKEITGGYLSKAEQDSRLDPGQGTVRVVFSKYDLMRLERVVGSKRVSKMIRERGDTFDFV